MGARPKGLDDPKKINNWRNGRSYTIIEKYLSAKIWLKVFVITKITEFHGKKQLSLKENFWKWVSSSLDVLRGE